MSLLFIFINVFIAIIILSPLFAKKEYKKIIYTCVLIFVVNSYSFYLKFPDAVVSSIVKALFFTVIIVSATYVHSLVIAKYGKGK